MHGFVRDDLYTFDWDEHRSTLEFGVGDVLEDRYDFEHNERLTLEELADIPGPESVERFC